MKVHNTLSTFVDYKDSDLIIDEQTYANYKGKYLDLHQKSKKEKVSILNDIDFEVELTKKEIINVAYILELIIKYKRTDEEKIQDLKDTISRLMSGDIDLRSKKELIDKFVDECLPTIENPDDIINVFYEFIRNERDITLNKMVEEENLNKQLFEDMIQKYLYSKKEPLPETVVETMNVAPKLNIRIAKSNSIIELMKNFIDKYITGITD